MVDESRVSRLDSLTGARFIAALMVFLFHAASMRFLQPNSSGGDTFLKIVSNAGNVAVSFFFVLSGFILTWSARKYDTRQEFWRRRFFKIFPNHIATFALSLFVYATFATAVVPGILNLALLHSWVPKMEYFLSFNYPTWSLSCELLFYAAFPFLLKAVQRIPAERLWWWAGGVVAAVFAVPPIAKLLPTEPRLQVMLTENGTFSQPLQQYWFINTFPPVRLLDFVLGILMARIVLANRWIGLRPLLALALGAGSYVLASFVPFHYSLNAVTIVPVALIIAAVANSEADGRPTFLSSRPMLWLGEISFAFYMLHVLLLMYARQQVGFRQFLSPLEGFGLIAFMLVATTVAAWLLYTTVERPMMRRFGTAGRKPSTAEFRAH